MCTVAKVYHVSFFLLYLYVPSFFIDKSFHIGGGFSYSNMDRAEQAAAPILLLNCVLHWMILDTLSRKYQLEVHSCVFCKKSERIFDKINYIVKNYQFLVVHCGMCTQAPVFGCRCACTVVPHQRSVMRCGQLSVPQRGFNRNHYKSQVSKKSFSPFIEKFALKKIA